MLLDGQTHLIMQYNDYFCGTPNSSFPNATLKKCPAALFDSALSGTRRVPKIRDKAE